MNNFNVKQEVIDRGLDNYEEIFDFFSSHKFTIFSKTKFLNYFKCLFNDNPFGKGLQIISRDPSGELIGYNSIFSVPFIYNGISIAGGQNINLLVHSDFRRKNLFLKMADKLFDSARNHNINLIYGFPNPAAVPGHIKTKGWNFKDLSYFKIKISEKFESEVKNKYILIKKFRDIPQNENNEIEKNNNLLQIHKTTEYLNWRFIKLGDFFKYDIFKILDTSDNFLGIVVLNDYTQEKITYGQILDSTIPINNSELLHDLLNFYIDYYKRKNTFNLQFLLLSDKNTKKFLKSRGFEQETKNRYFIFRSNNQKYIDAINSDRFLLYLSSKDNL